MNDKKELKVIEYLEPTEPVNIDELLKLESPEPVIINEVLEYKKKKSLWKIITDIILITLLLFSLYVCYYAFTNTDKFFENIDSIMYKITNKHLFIDINEKVNSEEIIALAKNKNYEDSVIYPYYELLNDNQRQIYNELLDMVNNYKELFKPYVNITIDEFKDIYHALLYDHPEIFWIDIGYYSETNIYNNIVNIKLVYKYDIDKIDDLKNKLDLEINKIVDEAKKYELDYEKELFVHNKLIDLIEYDPKTEDDQSVFGAVINKKAVCTGYTKAFQLIMMKLGIPTYSITGYAGENHSWNLVELEDGFYNVDLTWDDQERIIYKYFNVNDDMINIDHTRDEISNKLVKAVGNKYLNNYSTLNGK